MKTAEIVSSGFCICELHHTNRVISATTASNTTPISFCSGYAKCDWCGQLHYGYKFEWKE